jgi:RimJ/RimL family protein N-acetyltransferase
MSAPPLTVLQASADEAAAIRAAVRDPDLGALADGRTIATQSDARDLTDLLADPAVSDPIYDLPRPITLANVSAWIAAGEAERQRGEGLLVLTRDAAGALVSYAKFSVWPERSAAELAGATRADRQSRGQGSAGAVHSFGWMFESLGVRLIGLTAALDNIRSARLIDAAGFSRMGERESMRPDGGVRRSLYWEMTRDEWRRMSR